MLRLALSAACAVLVTASAAKAQDEFDNPTMGDVPCVVMSDYDTKRSVRDGQARHSVRGVVENVCGTAMEASVCFMFLEEDDDGNDRRCETISVRPMGKHVVRHKGPMRVVATRLDWRNLPLSWN